MAKQTNLYITDTIKTPGVSFANADSTTAKTLYTAGADDAVVKAIMATSTDGTARNLKLIVNDGSTDRCIGTVNIPLNAGTTGSAAAVDLLASTLLPGLQLDQQGKSVLPLQAGHVLKIAPLIAVTAAAVIDVVAVVEEY
jgi:hypothetical protein